MHLDSFSQVQDKLTGQLFLGYDRYDYKFNSRAMKLEKYFTG